jgi:hypothetical protein
LNLFKYFFVPLLLSANVLGSSDGMAQQAAKPEPLVIQDQGSLLLRGERP